MMHPYVLDWAFILKISCASADKLYSTYASGTCIDVYRIPLSSFFAFGIPRGMVLVDNDKEWV